VTAEARRGEAIAALLADLDAWLAAAAGPPPTPLEDLSLRHVAKAAGTARSALALVAAGGWPDACILVRAIFEQLFTYLWVVQDPARAEIRAAMGTLKQEWANAKYLEGVAANAREADRPALLAEVARYRAVAEALLAELAATLGTTEKKVRDEATMRVSLKAIEVSLGPAYSIPYAYYSGYVHSDGVALGAFGAIDAVGARYAARPPGPPPFPLLADLHRVMVRLASEARARCPRLGGPDAGARLAAHQAALGAVDPQDDSSAPP
jgi:hypothetical protein